MGYKDSGKPDRLIDEGFCRTPAKDTDMYKLDEASSWGEIYG
jgi:hypothetical protein